MLEAYMKEIGIEAKNIAKVSYSLWEKDITEKEAIKIIEKKRRLLGWVNLTEEEITTAFKSAPEILSVDIETILSKIGMLYILGYKPGQVAELIKETPKELATSSIDGVSLKNSEKDRLENAGITQLELFRDLGFTESQYATIIKNAPEIPHYDALTILGRIGHLYNMGYMPWDVVKMARMCSRTLSSPEEAIQSKFDDMLDMGFTKKQLMKITVAHAKIYSYSISSIQTRIVDIQKLRMSLREALRCVELFPPILSLAWNSCLTRVDEMIKWGLDENDTLHIIKHHPTIFGLSSSKCEDKITTFISEDLIHALRDDPRYLIQGADLTKARIRFFKENGTDYREGTNHRRLFRPIAVFSKTYNITHEELLRRYGTQKSEEVDF